MPRETVTNWGNFPSVEAEITESTSPPVLAGLIRGSDSVIARGNGRCYGDSSLNDNIISTLKLNRFLDFDNLSGELECESGVLFSEVLDVIVPGGFFLPVTPGTKFITLGGAIAADVHGKNHHRDGTFSRHVLWFDLMTASGEIVRCSRAENAGLFRETCGGMGLTGIILRARFRLRSIETSYIRQRSQKAKNIDKIIELFENAHERSYSVAWLDCSASGPHLGRSILISGEHCVTGDLPPHLVRKPLRARAHSRISIPFFLPAFLLNSTTVKAFNFLYYHRQWNSNSESIQHFDKYFYPLDSIGNWNRLYGRKGLLQYQFVLPMRNSYEGLKEILTLISRSGEGSPLGVLKLFGKENPDAVMSFPLEGYTMAVDFRVSDRVFRLLEQLDELVLKYEGRIYLAKDARMSEHMFHSTYPNAVSSRKFRSLQSARLNARQ